MDGYIEGGESEWCKSATYMCRNLQSTLLSSSCCMPSEDLGHMPIDDDSGSEHPQMWKSDDSIFTFALWSGTVDFQFFTKLLPILAFITVVGNQFCLEPLEYNLLQPSYHTDFVQLKNSFLNMT